MHSRSTAEAKTQALGGHVQVLGANVSEVAEEVRSGQLRLLGVMAPQRSRFLPDAPTFKEQGFNQVWSVSRGIAAPADLPKDVEAKLTAARVPEGERGEHQAADGVVSAIPTHNPTLRCEIRYSITSSGAHKHGRQHLGARA